jgi:anti-sigma B factor antagonist
VDVIEVALHGDLDSSSAPAWRARLLAISATQPDVLLRLRLGELEFIDSTGLGVLIGLRRHAVAGGGDVELVDVPDKVRTVLTVTGLDKVFSLAP